MTLIGELRDRISLLEPVYGDERTGQEQKEYAKRFDAYAKIEAAKARDVARFKQAGMRAEAIVTIRLALRIKSDWQVRIGGSSQFLEPGLYQIESVSHDDRRWTVLSIFRVQP